jgi:hypothetical protein
MHWDMRPLHDGADPSGELLAALVAPVPARPHRFTAKWRNRIEDSAMRAIRAIWPADRLECNARGIVIVIAGISEGGWKGHFGYLLDPEGSRSLLFSQGHNRSAIGYITPEQAERKTA